VAGTARACDEVVRLAPSYGATKTVKLTVAGLLSLFWCLFLSQFASGAFHSELMRPAYEKLEKVLENSTFAPPSIPVVFNVDGKEETDPKKIKQKLLEQVSFVFFFALLSFHRLLNSL